MTSLYPLIRFLENLGPFKIPAVRIALYRACLGNSGKNSDWRVFYRLGLAYEELKRDELATASFQKAARLNPACKNGKIYVRCSEMQRFNIHFFSGKTAINADDISDLSGQARVLVVCDSPGGAQYVEEDIGAFCNIESFTMGIKTLKGNREPAKTGAAPAPLWESGMTYNDLTDHAIAEETLLMAQQIADAFTGCVQISDRDEIRKILTSAMSLALGDAMYLMARAAVALTKLLRERHFTAIVVVAENCATATRLAPVISQCMSSGYDPWLLIAQKDANKRRKLTEAVLAPDFLNSNSENPLLAPPEEVVQDYRALSFKMPKIAPIETTTENHDRHFFVLVSPSDGNYSNTSLAIVREIAKYGSVQCYQLQCSEAQSVAFGSGLADLIDTGKVRLTSMSPSGFSFPNTDSQGAHLKFAAAFLASTRHLMELKAVDTNIYLFVRQNLVNVISRTFPFLVRQLDRIYSHLAEARPEAVIACPGRFPISHLLILSARMLSIPTIDVQAFFQSAHPRYVASPAEAFLMIDRSQIGIYLSRFSHLNQECVPVGSVMIHAGVARLRSFDRSVERDNFGVQPLERVILFATQHGLGDVNEVTLASLLETLAPVSGIRLLVKCHPREQITSHYAYQQIVSKADAHDWCNVITTGDIYKMISAADLVITQFSNVGLEAAVAGKPVLAINLLNRKYPVDLSELGICMGVNCKKQLKDVLLKFLNNGAYAGELIEKQKDYLLKNPELWEGDPARRIVDYVISKIPAKIPYAN
jgi:hypothetical protein